VSGFRREDPREVAVRVLRRAVEGGAFDDLLTLPGGALGTQAAWHAARGEQVRERVRSIVGRLDDLSFVRSKKTDGLTIDFWI
jgi:hypothetical protein